MSQTGPYRFPNSLDQFENLESFLNGHILHGFCPDNPYIGREEGFVCFGSCFAKNIHYSLINNGIENSTLFSISESANSVIAIEKMLRIAVDFELRKAAVSEPNIAWFIRHTNGGTTKKMIDAIKSARVCVLTVGIAVTGLDKDGFPTNMTMNKVVMPSVAQHASLLRSIHALLIEINTNIELVITVSPAPLAGSPIRGINAFTMDCISKTTLRAAVFEYCQSASSSVRYWPSFEATRWFLAHSTNRFGDADGNPRHVNSSMIDIIIKSFVKHFVLP